MHILVTNDDGIHAPGLAALAQAMRRLGDVTVVAPDRNWSASGHVKTLSRPLQVREKRLADNSTGLACDGAPSDCVALCLLGMLQKPVDLVVSGVNPFPNLGFDLTYSGTVTAAMEAIIGGVPAMAVSLCTPYELGEPSDYSTVVLAAEKIAANWITNGLTSDYLLNINVPFLPVEQIKGWQITRLGKRVYRDQLVVRHDPSGRPYYWIGGEGPGGIPDEGTDIGATQAGYVSITPVHMDMTSHQAVGDLSKWTW